jgi:hypothetical protein
MIESLGLHALNPSLSMSEVFSCQRSYTDMQDLLRTLSVKVPSMHWSASAASDLAFAMDSVRILSQEHFFIFFSFRSYRPALHLNGLIDLVCLCNWGRCCRY